MSECNHNCASCSANCEQRDLKIKANQDSHIKKIIGVVSSKGGVGKSLVTSLLAASAAKASAWGGAAGTAPRQHTPKECPVPDS